MAPRVSSPSFVGRGQELAALAGALERVADGAFSAVFLAGDSGVGKSRLLQEFERTASARGAHVLSGDCVVLAAGELPYAPIRSALRGLARALDPGDLDEALGPGRDGLARLVPELGGAASEPADAAAPLAQAQLFELLLGVLARLAADRPVVLAIEDIHWADRSTLDLLAFLVANARREPLLLVCTYRTDEVHRGHPLRWFLAEYERGSAVERVELDPFTREELGAQLQGILGSAPDPALADRLHERTDGNAFFTEELLAASGDGSALPASLRDALMLRIEVLPEPAQRVLQAAATHGRVVSHRLLTAVAELPERELETALREAVAHHVLQRRDDHTYEFRHALLQETLEADLLPGERTRLHLLLAQALADDPSLASRDGRAAAEICAHWLGAHRLPEALAAAVQAGTEAEEVYAFAAASRHFARALELWERVDDAAERAGADEAAIYARAGEAAHLSGDGPGSIRMVKAAIDLVDARDDRFRAAVLRENLGRYLYLVTGDTEGAEGAYRAALDLLPADEPRPELARALAAVARILMLRGHTEESISRCEQALAVARQAGARAETAHSLCTLGVNLTSQGDRDTGIEHLREALRMTEEIGAVTAMWSAYLNLSDALDQDGRLEEAVDVALAGAKRCRDLGLRDGRLLLEAEAASRLTQLGRLPEAHRLTDRAEELKPSVPAFHQCSTRARILVHLGRLEEAERLVAAAGQMTSFAPGATWVEPYASACLELELLRGRPEEAARSGAETLERVADGEKVFYTARLHALIARAEAELAARARAGGDSSGAEECAARADAVVARIRGLLDADNWLGVPQPEAVAYGELCALEAARAAADDGNAAGWSAIAKRWGRLGLALDEAYARLREAECLVIGRDRSGAERAVAAGLLITDRCGAAWLGGELASLARRGRLSVARPAGDGAGAARGAGDGAPGDGKRAATSGDGAAERVGLTARELAVLELVTGGMTNRQIGETLFISEKTVSVHVTHILAKLRVSSRTEAATAAHRLGIVQ